MIVQQLQRAFFLHQQGRLGDAAEAYKHVLKANPRNVDALNLLGQCCFHMGAPLEAAKHLNKCLKI